MSDMIRAHAQERPNHTAIVDGERVLTFAEFDALIDRAASSLQRDGVGDRGAVAMCGPSSIEYVTAFVAALRVGAAACPLAPSSTAEQLAAMVRDCGAGILFVDDSASAALDTVGDKLTINAAGLVTVICVLAWIGKSGDRRRMSRQMPISCTIAESTPAAMMLFRYDSASASSLVKMSVLNVTYARTPRRCRNVMSAGRSATVKFFARIRALKRSRPK